MKTKEIVFLIVTITVLGSCTTIKYLPQPDKIDVHEFGSYIIVDKNEGANVTGELIAIDSTDLFVLTGKTTNQLNKVEIVPISDIHRFSLHYAQNKNYGWSIVILTLTTFTHGYFAVITAPLNILITSIVTIDGQMAFSYNEREMTYDKILMFARFPQGIPAGIMLEDIK